MAKWNQADVDKLITLVEQRPCLYNVKSLEYLDRTKKAKVYQEIGDEMKKSMPGVTVQNIRAKWTNLRCQYMREMRAVKMSQKSGASPCDIYVPKLWCFGQLSFLGGHVKQRPGENTLPSVGPTLPPEDVNLSFGSEKRSLETETETCDESSSSKTPAKRKKTTHVLHDLTENIDTFSNVMANRQRKSEFKWLGDLVVSLMEKICPQKQNDAALKVHAYMTKLVADAAKDEESSSASTSQKDSASTSATQEGRDIIQISMDGLFEEYDCEEYLEEFQE